MPSNFRHRKRMCVASISRIRCLRWVGSLKTYASFAKEPYKRDYSAKETCNFKEPTNRSHSMSCTFRHRELMCVASMSRMRWRRLVGSLKIQVSFAEYSLFDRALLQKRPMFLGSLLLVATPCHPLFALVCMQNIGSLAKEIYVLEEPTDCRSRLTWGVALSAESVVGWGGYD